MHIVPNFNTCKLLCEYRGKQVKIEVNQTKRGIIGGEVQTISLSEKAQEKFSLYCEANVVPITQLYGGKIAAALSRQHPRDLFDVKYMNIHRKGYTVFYNKETMQPNWVAWHLTAEKTEGDNARPSSNAFHEDADVPSPRATLGDERDCNQSKGRGKPAGLEIKTLVKQTQKCSDFFFFN